MKNVKNRPRSLQNEALRPPKAPRVGHFELVGALVDALGDPRALRGCSRGLLGTLRQRSRRPQGALGDSQGRPRESLGPLFGAFSTQEFFPGDENGEMLEKDDPYTTLAMFLRSQEPRNEVKIHRKRL